MKKFATLAVASLFAVGVTGVAMAQDKTHSETTTKQTGPGPDTKSKAETVTGTVKGGIRVLAFEADEVNANVVIIMYDVVRDREKLHIAVQHHRFAPAKFAVIDFVAAYDEVMDRGVRVTPIGGNAVRAAVATTIFDVMHFVVTDFDERAVTTNRNSLWESRSDSARLEIAYLEANQFDILFVHNTDQPHLPGDGKSCAINDGGVARIVLQHNVIAN